MGVNWTSIDAFRIVEVGQSSSTAIVWIGVELGALSFEEGSLIAVRCRTLIDAYNIPDYHVEIRESRVVEQTGNRFLDPVDFLHPTFTEARDPYTATSVSQSPLSIGSGPMEQQASTSAPAVTTRASTSSPPGTSSSPSTRTITRKHKQ